jgi:hypothetical protein
LLPEELDALGSLTPRLNWRRVRLHRGAGGRAERLLRKTVLRLSGGRAVALGNHVFLPDACCRALPVLAHELTHCLQYQTWGPVRYLAAALADRVREVGHRVGLCDNPYAYQFEPGRPFETYRMEQQGQIVEDCFRGNAIASALSPYRPAGCATASRMADAKASTSSGVVSNAVIQRTSDSRSFQT